MMKSIFASDEKFDRFRLALLNRVRFDKSMNNDCNYLNQRFKIEGEIKNLKNEKHLFNWITDIFSDQLLNNETKLLLDIKKTILANASTLFSADEVEEIERALEFAATPEFNRKEAEELNATLDMTEEDDDGNDFSRTDTVPILFTDWFEGPGPKLYMNTNDKRIAPDTRTTSEFLRNHSKL